MKREVDFDKVVDTLRQNYEYALTQELIHKPIAWALYVTWKQYDRRK